MLIYDEGEGLGWGRRAVGGGKGIWKGEGGGVEEVLGGRSRRLRCSGGSDA